MLLQTRVASVRQLLHVKQLRRSRYEHRQDISALRLLLGTSVVIVVISVIILEQADVTHLVQELLELFLPVLCDTVQLAHLRKRVRCPLLHLQSDIRHLFRDDLRQPPVLRILDLHAADHVSCHIGDLLAERNDLFARFLVVFVVRRPLVVLLHIKCHVSSSCFPLLFI